MIKGALQVELEAYWGIKSVASSKIKTITAAAFCLARKKFSHQAFIDIRDVLTHEVYQSGFAKTWRGHRLLAVDGSALTLPITAETMSHFGLANGHAKHPTLRISQLYDVLNQQTVDFKHSSFSTGERELALQHASYLQDNDLVLYDRGYYSAWLFALHIQRKTHCCMRMKAASELVSEAFGESSKREVIIDLTFPKASRKHCKALNIPLEKINARLIKITLATGETEVLMTSLIDRKKYPIQLFQELYHQRWAIEEDYKLMKSRMEFENFTGKSSESILQDIYAKLVTKNIAAVIALETELAAGKNQKPLNNRTKANMSYVISTLKYRIVNLIMLPRATVDLLAEIIRLCGKQMYKPRLNRVFERQMTKMHKRKYFYSYKRTT